jgi:hypothetical protein
MLARGEKSSNQLVKHRDLGFLTSQYISLFLYVKKIKASQNLGGREERQEVTGNE